VSSYTEQRRSPIAPEYNSANHRLFSPATRPSSAIVSFEHSFEASEPTLATLFRQIESDYRSGVVAQRASDEQMNRVRLRSDLSWEPGEIENVAPHEDEKVRVAAAMEANAEIVLRTAGDLLTAVVVTFNGKDVALDAGPLAAPGVPVYRVLRAVGSYVRDRSDWRITYADKKRLKDSQLEFVRPLAKVISGRSDIPDSVAYEALLKEPSPMLRVLDVLSGYGTEAGAGSFEAFKRVVCTTGAALIHAQWQSWWDRRH
jgi:hypothetical protein